MVKPLKGVQTALCILFSLLFSALWVSGAHGEIFVPRNLNQHDRVETLRILGFGTTSKILSNPYPLGGYSGFEVGISLESINIEDLSGLGDTTPDQSDLTYPLLSVGKGLYNNFDLFLHFIPFLERTSLSSFGALLRWGLYQSAVWPISFALVIHANSANIANKVVTRSFGATMTGSFHLDDFAIYLGYGHTTLKGRFIGGAPGTDGGGITDSTRTENEETDGPQLVAGLSYFFNPIFAAVQADVYRDAVLSLKIGYRF